MYSSNKRSRTNYSGYDNYQGNNGQPTKVDVLSSRRMRFWLSEKPWYDNIDLNLDTTARSNTSTMPLWQRQELQEFKEEQRSIQQQMGEEALDHWKVLA